MSKSPDAFRTISEVAEWLGVQAHVLRFWESKFTQVKPIKRAGGRRYYRPSDMLLLGGLKKVLHEDGLTIKGAQKLLREKGVAHVADMSQPLDDLTMAALDEDAVPEASQPAFARTEAPAEEPPAQDVAEEADAPAEDAAPGTVQEAAIQDTAEAAPPDEPSPQGAEAGDPEPAPATASEGAPDTRADAPQLEAEETGTEDTEPLFEFRSVATAQTEDSDAAPALDTSGETREEHAPAGETADLPDFLTKPLQDAGEDDQTDANTDTATEEASPSPAENAEQTDAGTEAQTPRDGPADTENEDSEGGRFTVTPPVAAREPVRPAQVDVPAVPAEEDIVAEPSALTALSRLRRIEPGQARRIRPLLEQLVALRADLSGPGKDAGKD